MPENRRLFKSVYLFALIVMVFTGFGQMPIYKRYSISDIPGLGWSADFFTVHVVHYLGAILLLALFAYMITAYLFSDKNGMTLTGSAYVRMVFLAGLIVTGLLRVLKNLPDISFSPGFTLFIDITHLGFTMLFLMSALLFLILKRGWVVSR